MNNKAINALIEMGADAGNKGFQYIVDAIVLFQDGGIRNGKITVLYSKIAEMHNTSQSRVERCIRHSFKTVMEKGNQEAVKKYLPTQNRTNSNLLHIFYLRLNL